MLENLLQCLDFFQILPIYSGMVTVQGVGALECFAAIGAGCTPKPEESSVIRKTSDTFWAKSGLSSAKDAKFQA